MPFETTKESNSQTTEPNLSLGADVWKGMRRGVSDELQFDKDHPVDAAVRTTVAVGLGYITGDPYINRGYLAKITAIGGGAISTVHFLCPNHLSDMNEKLAPEGKTSTAETVGYLAGRYLFDASATIAVATGVNRSTWLVKGEREIKNIIETESRTIFHSAHKGTRGKWFRAYSEEQPIFLQERGENLAFLLEERNQPQRLAGLLSRLENKIEPENLSKISGSRYYTQQYLSKVPAFEPAKLIASVQGLK